MKTFVTGGTGLLGANIIRELLKRGHEVRVLVRAGSNLRAIKNLEIEYYNGDLSDLETLRKGCSGCDFIIHSAANPPGSSSRFSDFVKTNIEGTKNIVRVAENVGVKRMIYVSSCCVFGGGSKEYPGTELSEFTGFRFDSGYINSKYVAQQWVLSEIEKKSLPIVIVNPTMMIGPYDAGPSSGEIILRLLRHQIQFCPMGGKNFIDVRDAAEATCNALRKGTIGECYLLASENLTFSEFFDRFYNVIRERYMKVKVPGFILNAFGLTGDLINLLTKKSLSLNYTNSRQLACKSYFSGNKATKYLGLIQKPIDSAIRDAVDWFARHHYFERDLLSKSINIYAA